uniref:Uncharacterized protein n=1 Tax=Anguilla anguilla TaxID=7936 RepID=A0A0E9SV43_ANGAN
METGGKTTG